MTSTQSEMSDSRQSIRGPGLTLASPTETTAAQASPFLPPSHGSPVCAGQVS